MVRWWTRSAWFLCGLLFATITILLGPKHMVVCSEARWPNTILRDIFAHVDGESFTGCDVPTAETWAAAAALLIAPTVTVAFVRWSRP